MRERAVEVSLQEPQVLRFSVLDQPGVLARIAGILGDFHISISEVVQMTEILRLTILDLLS